MAEAYTYDDILAAFDKKTGRYPERVLQARFIESEMREDPSRRDMKEFVKTPVGVADIVDDDTIYEVKAILDTTGLHSAIGQLFAYSYFLKGRKKCIITQVNLVGDVALDVCYSYGISVIEFK